MRLYTHTHTDTSSKIKNLVNNKIKINKIYSKSYAGNNYKIAGITLIALVITVIILIILAGITIGTLKNFSLFDKAKKAKKDYTSSQKQEENRLNEYESQISEAEGNDNYTNIYKGKTWNFDYTGGEQMFQVPADGIYKLETWGASGNTPSNLPVENCGYGGYAVGNIQLKKDEILYINVGGQGQDGIATIAKGGYNGGGNGKDWSDGRGAGGGGGATHIAKISGILQSIGYTDAVTNQKVCIVAGGGGGVGGYKWQKKWKVGSGGGIKGGTGETTWEGAYFRGHGGTQEDAGKFEHNYYNLFEVNSHKGSNAEFGQGGSNGNSSGNMSGGGGGLWGGAYCTNCSGAGGGGSGYIGNSLLSEKHMAGYNVETSDDETTKTISTTKVSETSIEDYAKKGNGYAKITCIK